MCHSLTKAGPAKAEGRGNSWCPSLTREGCGISLLLLLFSFPYYLSHSLTCLYFPLPPTSCPHFSISFLASFFYLFFLVFLLSLLLFLPLTVCPLSSPWGFYCISLMPNVSIKWSKDKQNTAHPRDGILVGEDKGWRTDSCRPTNETQSPVLGARSQSEKTSRPTTSLP